MQPRPPQVLLDRGSEAYRAGNYERAAPLLQEFADRYERHPRMPQVMRMLCASLVYSSRRDESIAQIDRALERSPGDEELTLIRGHALRLGGRGAEAALEYEKLLAAPPGIRAQALAALAEVRLRQRRPDEARGALDRAEREGLTNARLDLARAMLALGTPAERPGAIDRLAALRAGGEIEPELRPGLLAALGDLFDAEERYDEAFEAYTQSNQAAGGVWDGDEMERRVNAIIAAWPAERVRELQKWGSDSARPVLIVGMPRSGTTLTEQLVGRHPRAARAGELRRFRDIVHGLRDELGGELHDRADRLTEGHLRSAASSYLSALDDADPSADRVADKMPLNAFQLGFIGAVFPNAHIIHCRRDPRDVCLSCYARHFMHDHPWTTRLDWLARFYRQYVRVMDHWREVFARLDRPPMLEVFYERVVTDADAWAAHLHAFIGLSGGVAHGAVAEDAPTLRADQVGRGVYDTSRGRHRRYLAHLAPLIDGLDVEVERYELGLASGVAGLAQKS